MEDEIAPSAAIPEDEPEMIVHFPSTEHEVVIDNVNGVVYGPGLDENGNEKW